MTEPSALAFTDVESGRTSELEEQIGCDSDEDLDEDPDFVDYAYAQSEEDVRLLRIDDHQFEGYIDHEAIDIDPNAGEEDEESDNNPASPRMCTPEHSSEFEVETGKSLRKRKLPNFKDFIPSIDMINPQFELGLRFESCEIFRAAVRRHSVLIGRELKFKVNDSSRIRVICDENCPFHLYASTVHGSKHVQVKTFVAEHTCGHGNVNIHANAKYLSKWYESDLTNPKWDVGSFQEKVNQETGYYPSRAQAYRARSLATMNIEGSYTKQYELLWDYCEELKRTNPGSSVVVKSELEGDRPRFQRIYICLQACKQGFLDGCRPYIGLDGCHIKGPHPGQLLCAVGVDANNGMFPLAYVVAEVEMASSQFFLFMCHKNARMDLFLLLLLLFF